MKKVLLVLVALAFIATPLFNASAYHLENQYKAAHPAVHEAAPVVKDQKKDESAPCPCVKSGKCNCLKDCPCMKGEKCHCAKNCPCMKGGKCSCGKDNNCASCKKMKDGAGKDKMCKEKKAK